MEHMENYKETSIHSTHKKAVVAAVIIFLLIIAGMFTFAYLKKSEQATTEDTTEQEEENPTTPYDYITRVDGTHYYIDGVHTVVGEIPMPTPCDLLEADAIVAESYPEQISINFNVINNAETCTQVITPARYKVEAAASPEATFSATFMGRSVELNLTPAPEGETPDDFEVFIKG